MTTILFLLFLSTLIGGIGLTVIGVAAHKGVPAVAKILFALCVPLFLLFSSFTTVDAGSVGIVTKFGKVESIIGPGAHLVLPIVEAVHPMTTQTLVTKPNEDAASHDLQMVKTEITLAYHFDPAYEGYLYEHVADASDNSIERKVVTPAILEAIKSVTARYDAQELVAKRPEVRDGIEAFVKDRLLQYHIIAETVSITSFHFSDEYEKSIEAKVVSVQEAEQAKNILAKVQIEADQKVAAAKGEAEALRAQKEQITPELLQLRTIEMMKEKWDGALPVNYYGGQAPLPIVQTFGSKAAQK